MNKVVIIGCGNVGMSYAYSLVISGSNVDELVLIDINEDKAQGEALDLNHALSYAPKSMLIKKGNYKDCADADIICICAGRNQNPGETRTDLIYKNKDVFKSIISSVKKTKFKGFFLIATNPLDTMTYITQQLSEFDYNRVIGSGTTLDTARLKYLIGKELNFNTKDIHAYVMGEHGDSEFVAWDNALIGGNKCKSYLSKEKMQEISNAVVNSAYEIIEKKGNTSYGIGMCLLGITNAILNNERKILTISCYDKENNIYYSRPAVIGKNGVEEILNIEFSKTDEKHLQKSIKALQKLREEVAR